MRGGGCVVGGMHGRGHGRGTCMAGGMHGWGCAWQEAVCILLECILVPLNFRFSTTKNRHLNHTIRKDDL